MRPRPEPFAVALGAFSAAEYARCMAVLEQHETVAAVALRSRCLLRLGRPGDVHKGLENVAFDVLAHDEAGELLSLASRAYVLTGDTERADAYLTAARARAYSAAVPALECEVAYVAAQIAWLTGRYDVTEPALEEALQVESVVPPWLARRAYQYPFPLAYWRARSLELRSSTSALGENFKEQAARLEQALQEYDACGFIDAYAEASMLFNLSVLVRDLDLPSVAEDIRARAERMPWTGDAAPFKFYVYESLGWCKALRGDHLGALRDFRACAEAAPSVPLRVWAALDRAFLARELDERLSSAEELQYAIRLAEVVDWESAPGEERLALLLLAQQSAPGDPQRARRFLETYDGLKRPLSPALFGRRNRRVRADECYATAHVLLAENQPERATSLLIEAFEIWTAVNYEWHAARAAADLAELTGHEQFFTVAEREAHKRPNSWLTRRVAALARSPVPA